VIEAIRDKNRTLSREAHVKEHEIAPEIVESELRDAGFEIVEPVDAFTTVTRPPPGGFWMIRTRRP
jgi:hypothetical protein